MNIPVAELLREVISPEPLLTEGGNPPATVEKIFPKPVIHFPPRADTHNVGQSFPVVLVAPRPPVTPLPNQGFRAVANVVPARTCFCLSPFRSASAPGGPVKRLPLRKRRRFTLRCVFVCSVADLQLNGAAQDLALRRWHGT